MSIKEIMSLPPAEKIQLVEQIWDSLDHEQIEITDAQKDELDYRKRLDKKDEMSWHSWSEVKAKLQSRRR